MTGCMSTFRLQIVLLFSVSLSAFCRAFEQGSVPSLQGAATHNYSLSHQARSLGGSTCDISGSHVSDSLLDPGARARAVAVPGHLGFWKRIHDNFCGEPKKPIKFLILGASVEWQPWVGQLCQWVKTLLPGSKCWNGALSSTGSKELLRLLPQSGGVGVDIHQLRPDVILLDTSLDLWNQQGPANVVFPPIPQSEEAKHVELIVRQVLQYDWHPLLFAMEWLCVLDIISLAPNFITNEDYHRQVYEYYGIPVISGRAALWPRLQGDTDGFKDALKGGYPFMLPKQPTEDLVATIPPGLNVTSILIDGVHPTSTGGELLVNLISGFLADGLRRVDAVLREGTVYDVTTLPPMLMTQDQQNVMFRMGDSHSSITTSPPAAGVALCTSNSANITSRAADMLTVVSLSSILGWEVLQILLSSNQGADINLPRPPRMPMHMLAAVRIISHFHIAVMHYYQLQPAGAGALLGFPNWAQWGWCWVQFFFMVSGFVLYLSNAGSDQDLSGLKFVSFARKRISTLYPVFFLSVAIALACGKSRQKVHEHPEDLAFTIFLIQSWVRPYGYVHLNGPSWYLCSLFCFYMIFPRWLGQVKRTSRPRSLLCFLWVAACAVPIATTFLGTLTGRPIEYDLESGLMSFIDFHPACNWPLFLFGMVLARCCCEWYGKPPKCLPPILGTMALTFLLSLFAFMRCPSLLLKVFFNKGPFLLPSFSCLLIGLALTNFETLDSLAVPAAWIAGVAWGLYILHVPLFFAFRSSLAMHGISSPESLVVLAAGVAVLVNALYDRPIQRLLREDLGQAQGNTAKNVSASLQEELAATRAAKKAAVVAEDYAAAHKLKAREIELQAQLEALASSGAVEESDEDFSSSSAEEDDYFTYVRVWAGSR